MGHNQGRAFNRPLYVANTNAFVLAGDLPAARFVAADTIHGTLVMGISRGGRTHGLQDMADVTLEYRPAHARWVARDPAVAGLVATFEVVAMRDEVGFAARVHCAGARRGDMLVWAYGGAITWPGPEINLNWDFDPHVNPAVDGPVFDPAHCVGNAVEVGRGGFTVTSQAGPAFLAAGRCSVADTPVVDDAFQVAAWASSPCHQETRAGSPCHDVPSHGRAPLVGGRIDLRVHPEATWSFARVAAGAGAGRRVDPGRRFTAGLARSAALASRIVVETPEARLNVAASLVPAALDGAWYPPVFRHGGMLWNRPYPGWRTMCGGTAAGWHERVRAEAEFYCGHQVRSSRNRSGRADPARLLTGPAPDSRFYGRGRILQDQGIYDMQSQFFDQLVHAWRWTGDAALEKLLRPALELHLGWIRDCFDPDGDGLYESVINGWPTDSVWYGGGGATEETAYAYRGHVAARELALRAGDRRAAHRHGRIARRIKAAFHARLWIKDRGHAGLYREQGGLQRLHEDAWLYSIFLPIDTGLVDAESAAASLHYSEWALQNERMPYGGRRVWTSNFVPGIWSVRELWPGDNYHLALAYFQAGLGRDGWEVFRGTFQQTVFDTRVPGDFGSPLGGTDFGDSTHMFARTLVEGLFGYAPDYPNGVVRVAPQFPEEWPRARLRTPDVTLGYARRKETIVLEVSLARAARREIRLAVCAREIVSVTANGRAASWRAEPGFGCTVVCVSLREGRRAVIAVRTRGSAPTFAPVAIVGAAGRAVVLRARAAAIVEVSDPQGALAGIELRRGAAAGRLAGTVGWHTAVARADFGSNPQRRLFRVRIEDPAPPRPALRPAARARWDCIDLGRILNGDIRAIFQQRYLSPRPKTMSIRIGSDGYSPWTFVYWNSGPPKITLDGVPPLLGRPGRRRLLTPQGVPFTWPGERRNIAFTSRWDNWPDRISVRVGRSGSAVWFLVCGSTNPMQCRIANAVLRLRYADGVEESLELVPPVNYWNLCPIRVNMLAPGQENRTDYTDRTDAFCLPAVPPATVQLGDNCRAMLLDWPLRPGVVLERVTLETLSAEVVVGLMGVTVMR